MEHRFFYMKSKKLKDCLKYACISNIDKVLIFQDILLGDVQDIKTTKVICTPVPLCLCLSLSACLSLSDISSIMYE